MANGPISYTVSPSVGIGGVQATLLTDNPTGDPFGALRVSQRVTQLDLKQLYDALPLFYDDQETSGGGTASSYYSDNGATNISTSSSTAGTRVRQSKQRGAYQPGKGLLVLVTGVMGGSETGTTKRWGYFDGDCGLFFQHADGVLSVVRRTKVTGTPADNVVAQANWNLDKLNGTGASGITLNVAKANIFVIDFEWLGVGRVRFGVNIDGVTYYCHELLNANNLTEVYMGNPNLPIRYEISNDGNAGADSMTTICASIMSEGGFDDNSKTTYLSRGGTSLTLGNQDTLTPVISIRLASGQLSTRVKVLEVDLLGTSPSLNYEWVLLLNPTVGGTLAASWQSVTNSSVEYDITRNNTNTISDGYRLAGGYGSSGAQVKTAVSGVVDSFLSLGSTIAGASDEIVLCVQNIDANNGTIYGGITVGEYI